MEKIKVLIVDDSPFMRRLFEDLLSSQSDMEVAGRARNGSDALEKIAILKPDVVTLDVEMPVMDGPSALKIIMRDNPLPVIMVSTLTAQGADITVRCLEEGAIDFVQKPSGRSSEELESLRKGLLEKIRTAMAVRLSNLPLLPEPVSVPQYRKKVSDPFKGVYDLLLIASSTGGPQALSRLLPDLPENFSVPLAIVQHMPAGFTASFTKRLDQLSAISVCEAEEGMPLEPGKAVIAPGGRHLLIKRSGRKFVCSLSDLPPVNSVRPAADCLFNSVALVPDTRAAAVILTGMGRDGTAGAKSLKAAGAVVMAESEETAVVYGMPRCAREAGVVDLILPLDQIGPEITKRLHRGILKGDHDRRGTVV